MVFVLARCLWHVRQWLDHRLGIDVFWLDGDEIVAGPGKRREQRVNVKCIHGWQCMPDMGFDSILIEVVDNRRLLWFDRYGDLIALLRELVPDKEITCNE